MKQGIWEQQRRPLWQEMFKLLPEHEYVSLLAEENEVEKLLEVVRRHPAFVFQYGKQLAGSFPSETFTIYEEYIVAEAREASERRKYRQVCRMIKDFAASGAKEKAIELIDRLATMYPRRSTMLEELSKLKKRLET